jgi:hypothetical protein
LALTSPTSGVLSVGIVRWRTKAPEFGFCLKGSNRKMEKTHNEELRDLNLPQNIIWVVFWKEEMYERCNKTMQDLRFPQQWA